jgi:hypothetical protein
MLGMIQILAESGLTSMMVLHDYVSKHIMPLQERTHPTWLYIEVNDVTRLDYGDGSALSEEAPALVMGKLSPDSSSHDFVTPPVSCQPLFMGQVARSLLLVAMPLMDDVGNAPIQGGDQSRGVQITETGTTGGQGGAVPTLPPARERGRWCESSAATTKYHPMTMFRCRGGRGCLACLINSGAGNGARGGDGSSAAGDTAVATRAVIVKEVADAAAVKKVVEEAAEKKKGTEEAAAKKKAVKEAAVKKAIEEAAIKRRPQRRRRRRPQVMKQLRALAHLQLHQ